MKIPKINILIVEDSKSVSSVLNTIFDEEPDMRVVGVCENGLQAVEMAKTLKPDLITMDIEMPELNGIDATKKIMLEYPTPIIIISEHLDENANNTFKALDAGALAVMQKPKSIQTDSFKENKQYMLETIRSLAGMTLLKKAPKTSRSKKKIHVSEKEYNHRYDLLALGASTGGPSALKLILSVLPENFSLPILLVQHISTGFDDELVQWLNGFTHFNVKIAEENEMVLPGSVYVSPNNLHLSVKKIKGDLSGAPYRIRLLDSPPIGGFRPSIDVLFTSIAEYTNGYAIAGLLTGMGHDGAQGLRNMRAKRCTTFVQDENSCVVFGMPKAALKIDAAQDILSLDQIPAYLVSLVADKKDL